MKVYCVFGQIGTDHFAYEELVKIFTTEKRADTWIALVGKYLPLDDEETNRNTRRYVNLRIEEREVE